MSLGHDPLTSTMSSAVANAEDAFSETRRP
jgi:hypothetical protein